MAELVSGEGGRMDFIREIVRDDVAAGRHEAPVTRFPPEPNGYLHIGHAKAICLNFGLAAEYAGVGGRCHLRFDDTNPLKEEQEYVDSIMEDVRWLGFDWGEHLYFASDGFGRYIECAEQLIRDGLAYVDEQSAAQIRATRGTLTEPGVASPFRDAGVAENLERFGRMREGRYPEGGAVLRARIDMGAANLNLRDPVLYRVLHAAHHHAGEGWKVYPMYDFAHPLEDAYEGVTHSLCTLEFEDHRPLYDWVVEHCQPTIQRHLGRESHPRQIEFARMNLTYTVMSKRKLLRLVQEGLVAGWDDPRLPTLSGLRRRGVPAEAVRAFCRVIGLTKTNSLSDIALLEHAVREVLNREAPRYMAVLDPLKLVITNWSDGMARKVCGDLNPENPDAGHREIPFGPEIWIERADFMEDPPKGYFRLRPDGEVRLRHAYIVRCEGVERGPDGRVAAVRCTADPETLGQNPADRKVKGVIHWVPCDGAVRAAVRLYDRLFQVEDPDAAPGEFVDHLNPDSLREVAGWLEPALAGLGPGERVQFERLGYFCVDRDPSVDGMKVFNRTVALRDAWSKQAR